MLLSMEKNLINHSEYLLCEHHNCNTCRNRLHCVPYSTIFLTRQSTDGYTSLRNLVRKILRQHFRPPVLAILLKGKNLRDY